MACNLKLLPNKKDYTKIYVPTYISVLALLNQQPKRELMRQIRAQEQAFFWVICLAAQTLVQNWGKAPKCAYEDVT